MTRPRLQAEFPLSPCAVAQLISGARLRRRRVKARPRLDASQIVRCASHTLADNAESAEFHFVEPTFLRRLRSYRREAATGLALRPSRRGSSCDNDYQRRRQRLGLTLRRPISNCSGSDALSNARKLISIQHACFTRKENQRTPDRNRTDRFDVRLISACFQRSKFFHEQAAPIRRPVLLATERHSLLHQPLLGLIRNFSPVERLL